MEGMQPPCLSVNTSDLRSMTIVEMPCFVRDARRGVEILGGIQNVVRALSSKVYDPYSLVAKVSDGSSLKQGLISDRVPCSGLLVKIRRKKIGDNAPTIEVLGKVTSRIQFTYPADFQFLPATNSLTPREVDIKPILEAIPRPFLNVLDRSDMKLFVKPSKKKEKDFHNHNKKSMLIQFDDPIPDIPVDPFKRRNAVQFGIIYNKVKSLFEKCPIWFRRDIERVPELRIYILGEVLPLLAYSFSNGPWRGLWCRHGYDPRKDPGSRIMQVVDVRMSRLEYSEMIEKISTHVDYRSAGVIHVHLEEHPHSTGAEASAGESESLGATGGTTLMAGMVRGVSAAVHSKTVAESRSRRNSTALRVFLFGTEVRQQFGLQIFDIADVGIFSFVSGTPRTSVPSRASGWYLQSTQDEIRRRIIAVLNQRVQTFILSKSSGVQTAVNLTSSATDAPGSPSEPSRGQDVDSAMDVDAHHLGPGPDYSSISSLQAQRTRYFSIPDVVAIIQTRAAPPLASADGINEKDCHQDGISTDAVGDSVPLQVDEVSDRDRESAEAVRALEQALQRINKRSKRPQEKGQAAGGAVSPALRESITDFDGLRNVTAQPPTKVTVDAAGAAVHPLQVWEGNVPAGLQSVLSSLQAFDIFQDDDEDDDEYTGDSYYEERYEDDEI